MENTKIESSYPARPNLLRAIADLSKDITENSKHMDKKMKALSALKGLLFSTLSEDESKTIVEALRKDISARI